MTRQDESHGKATNPYSSQTPSAPTRGLKRSDSTSSARPLTTSDPDGHHVSRFSLNAERQRVDELRQRDVKLQTRWERRHQTIVSNIPTLKRFLDRCTEARPGSDRWFELQQEFSYHFPIAGGPTEVDPVTLRVGLELAELWLPLTSDRIRAALKYAVDYVIDLRRLYVAVRGDAAVDPREVAVKHGWKTLPWAVLRPLHRLSAYDVLEPGRPRRITARSLSELTFFKDRYAAMHDALHKGLTEIDAARSKRYHEALVGDAPLNMFASALGKHDPTQRPALQRSANEGREKQAWRDYFLGDRIVDMQLVLEVEAVRAALARKVGEIAQLLKGTRPANLARKPQNLAHLRSIAAELIGEISSKVGLRRSYQSHAERDFGGDNAAGGTTGWKRSTGHGRSSVRSTGLR